MKHDAQVQQILSRVSQYIEPVEKVLVQSPFDPNDPDGLGLTPTPKLIDLTLKYYSPTSFQRLRGWSTEQIKAAPAQARILTEFSSARDYVHGLALSLNRRDINVFVLADLVKNLNGHEGSIIVDHACDLSQDERAYMRAWHNQDWRRVICCDPNKLMQVKPAWERSHRFNYSDEAHKLFTYHYMAKTPLHIGGLDWMVVNYASNAEMRHTTFAVREVV